MPKAIFLDRDGVLIRSDMFGGKPIAVQEMARLELLAGVEEACAQLREAGFILVMVTNQPDIGRGLVSRAAVDEMNEHLAAVLKLDAVKVCPHGGTPPCACRKPEPGMLLEAARELAIDLSASVMVGDRWRDVETGLRAGCATVYIDWGHDEPLTQAPDFRAPSLLAAVPWIKSRSLPPLRPSNP